MAGFVGVVVTLIVVGPFGPIAAMGVGAVASAAYVYHRGRMDRALREVDEEAAPRPVRRPAWLTPLAAVGLCILSVLGGCALMVVWFMYAIMGSPGAIALWFLSIVFIVAVPGGVLYLATRPS